MLIQLIAIILLFAISLGLFLVYHRMDRTYYIEYTEKGSIDYAVRYAENDFFDSEWIGVDQTYISSLIEEMTADFSYRLNTNSSDLGFSYRYKIDAKLVVASEDTGVPYYTFEENILPVKEAPLKNSSGVRIDENVSVDYVKYNKMAKSFVKTYDLQSLASATLLVTLDVEIVSSNHALDVENTNKYTTTLNVPLIEESFGVYTTSGTPDNDVKVLEYQDITDKKVLFIFAVVTAALAALMVIGLFIFLHMTKNEDITYAAKIRKLLRSYGSYIQRMDGEFDDSSYQCVMIKTFSEMLGIRDTIQSPILMSENHDETKTKFLIPTGNRILYVFEIKVDNYDAIYGTADMNETVEEFLEV